MITRRQFNETALKLAALTSLGGCAGAIESKPEILRHKVIEKHQIRDPNEEFWRIVFEKSRLGRSPTLDEIMQDDTRIKIFNDHFHGEFFKGYGTLWSEIPWTQYV